MSHASTAKTQTSSHTILWILFSLIALAGLSLYFKYQTEIFPTITTPITINEQGVRSKALAMNKNYKIGLNPQNVQAATSYLTNSHVNNYITLKAGGNKELNKLLNSGYLISSFWSVRLYEENNPQEQLYRFSSDGGFYGFHVTLPEYVKLPNISKLQALKQIDIFLSYRPLAGVNFPEYTLKDYSTTTLNNGRIDHHFTYEHKDKRIAKASFKLNFTIKGNTITSCKAYLDIPESFFQEYNQMRTYNHALSNIGNVILYVGYGLTMIAALVIGWRENLLEWRNTGIMTAIIVLFGALGAVNELPSMWYFEYNTIHTFAITYIQWLIRLINMSIYEIITIGITFIAGDFITRRAFPEHVNFWSAFKKDYQSSNEISKQIGIGYGLFCIDLGYIALFYITVLQIPGVWSPSSNLQNPGALNDLLPFFSPIARSLHAGFWEEFLFRAVPIGASMLFARLLKKDWLIIPMLLLQAVIFGLAHANYAQQPSYIRVIELSIIFCIYGVIYLRYGLIPCVLSHYLFDVLVMSQSLFFIHTPHIIWQQVAIILALAAPFLYHLIQRVRTGHLLNSIDLPKEAYNKGWQQPTPLATTKIIPIPTQPISTTLQQGILLSSILITGTLFYYYPQLHNTSIPGLSVTKQEALQLAENFTKDKLDPNKKWTINILANHVSSNAQLTEQYLKDILGKYKLVEVQKNRELQSKLGSTSFDYILPYNTWTIKYNLFEGTDKEKTESYTMHIRSKTHPVLFNHHISEEVSLPNLNAKQAQGLADYTLKKLTTSLDKYKIISTHTETQPSKRIDHAITYQDKIHDLIPGLDLRWDFEIQGDQISSLDNYLKIPEKWQKQRDIEVNKLAPFAMILQTINTAVYLAVIIYCLRFASLNFHALPSLAPIGLALITIYIVETVNALPSSFYFLSPLKPLANQWISFVSYSLINTFIFTSEIGLLYVYIFASQRKLRHQQSPGIVWICGILLGFSCTSIFSLLNQYFGYQSNLVVTLGLNNYLPVLNYITSTCIPYVRKTLFLLALCQIYSDAAPKTSTSGIYAKLLFFISIFAFVFDFDSTISFNELAIYSSITGIVILLLYNTVVQKNILVLWGITAGNLLLNNAYGLSLHAHYPSAWLPISISLSCLALLSYLLTVQMTDQQATS